MSIDTTDRRLLAATQAGLPLAPRPFEIIGQMTGLSEAEVIARMQALQDRGVIRRIGAAPNHYTLGITANGLSVWDVEDAHARDWGARIGALDFVSQCVLRPRTMPDWPYNLFAVLHGTSRDEVARRCAEIADLLGPSARAHDLLFAPRILKQTGVRLPREVG